VPDEIPAGNLTLWCALGSFAALELLDERALQTWVDDIERLAREHGSIVLLRTVLYGKATAAGLCGRLAEAEILNSELRQLHTVTAAPDHLNAVADVELLGLRGRNIEARAAAQLVVEAAAATGFGVAEARCRLALVRLDLAAGNYADALGGGMSVADGFVASGTLVLPDVVEAAARSGDTSAARSALDRLTERAEASGTLWALGLLSRSRALLAADDEAEALYEEAVHRLD
jgi:hypothetical protein